MSFLKSTIRGDLAFLSLSPSTRATAGSPYPRELLLVLLYLCRLGIVVTLKTSYLEDLLEDTFRDSGIQTTDIGLSYLYRSIYCRRFARAILDGGGGVEFEGRWVWEKNPPSGVNLDWYRWISASLARLFFDAPDHSGEAQLLASRSSAGCSRVLGEKKSSGS